MDGFDLDRYLRASKKIDLSGLAWDRIGDSPLTAEEARCLAYMMDIESHTIVFLRDLLATSAATEPDVTAFLSCWAYEELWHGEAFSRFLGEAGYQVGAGQDTVGVSDPYPSRVARNGGIRRALGAGHTLGHLGSMMSSALLGRDFVAVHMTWGAVNELSTLTAYQRLVARTEHPVLTDLLRRIIKDERRHYAFYRAQAQLRLSRSPRARRITRWAMTHLWAPVGTGVRPQSETDFVITHLFGDADGMTAVGDMDATVSSLPGLADTGLFRIAREEALARVGPRRPRSPRAAPVAPEWARHAPRAAPAAG